MCKLFSFNMNNKGKAFFFGGAQRRRMMEENWKPVDHFDNPDSHTTINRYYKLNDDSVGKYEYVNGKFIVDTSHGEIDSMAKLWTKTKEFKEVLKGITVSGLWYGGGTKKRFDEYRNGKRHGKCKWWYPNGNKNEISEYKNGELHGKCQSWYDNGNKIQIAEYRNGERHGKCQSWLYDGKLKEVVEYKNGRIVG